MKISEINKRKKEVLDEIHSLHKVHKARRGACNGCKTCKRVKALGAEYEQLTLLRREMKNPHVSEILAKGDEATLSEVKYLLEIVKLPRIRVAEGF